MTFRLAPERVQREISQRGGARFEVVRCSRARERSQDALDGTPARSGRTYTVSVGSRVVRHVASAPGEPPAELSGELRKKLGTAEGERGGDPFIGFGSSAEHAPHVTKLRPFWEEIFEKNPGRDLARVQAGVRLMAALKDLYGGLIGALKADPAFSAIFGDRVFQAWPGEDIRSRWR